MSQHRSALAGVEACSLRTERAFPRHSHDQFGIGVIAQGAQRSWSGVGAVEAGPGDVIMVNPGEVHDGIPLGDGARSWRMLYIEPLLVQRSLASEIAETPEIVRPVAQDRRLAQSFARLFRTVTAPGASILQCDEALVLTLGRLARRHMTRAMRPSAVSPPVARAREKLDDTIDGELTLAELAALTGLSRFQLLRGFARETGLTPHAYLLQRRVGLAKRRLATSAPLAAIAHDLGFSDQSHFTRAFKRQFGVTPGQYRAALR